VSRVGAPSSASTQPTSPNGAKHVFNCEPGAAAEAHPDLLTHKLEISVINCESNRFPCNDAIVFVADLGSVHRI
jgi:hypothetical protein